MMNKRKITPVRQATVLTLAFCLCFNTVIAQQTSTPTTAMPQPAPAETYEALAARLAAHIAQPKFAPAAWGVKVVSLASGKTIFEHNGEKYFSPASNAKLYTCALALDRLGADYRIRTSLYSTAQADPAGTLKGDLTIYGRGDPTIAARLREGNYDKPFEPFIAQLKAAGVQRIEGDVIGDESYFHTPPLGAGWEWDDLQEYYGAEVSALSIHDNALDVFVKPAERLGLPGRISTGPAVNFLTFINRTQTAPKGTATSISYYRPVGENLVYVSGRLAVDNAKGSQTAIAVHNPALLFVTLLKDALIKNGIAVKGRARVLDWKYREVTPLDLSKFTELGFVESPPMKEIVREVLKPSQNLYAQLCLLQVGVWSLASGVLRPDNLSAAVGSNQNALATSTSNGQSSSVSLVQTQNTQSPATAEAGRQTPDDSVTTEARGIEALQAFLQEVGIKKGEVLLEEGSGLSRKDVVTPNATIALLKFMHHHQFADAYRDGLPIAGVDGTLKNRMKDTAASGNVRGKTGTLRYVYALSGYVTTAAGEPLAFSIMLNNYYNADRSIAPRDDVDAIPIMLANFTGKK
ncbi:MAG: D-alanyl-D-alanine carboxypeptidase/D-alanyl-D-alanine-endopeptidase [Acidobacteria bacterium]|nr:D-alanyl-D-alanine carboxypeptidase/D-alanyl-D-alanine-endopeptidase [Acidobacteriota bacterium]